MNRRIQSIVTLPLTMLFSAALLSAQAPDRGPVGAYWAPKTKGGVYLPPNKPLTKLADSENETRRPNELDRNRGEG